jgi:hypothetical protein
MSTHVRRAIAVGVAALALPVASASAADPGRWRLSDVRPVPLEYFQGLTHAPDGARFFSGLFDGLYRTDLGLAEQARRTPVLPPAVAAQGFNHVGDISWDAREGGRVLLPLECYVPGGPNGGNTCGRGAIGIADPATLAFRHLVPLDPADIPKAMWGEVSPDGALWWTSSRADLLAYRTADISAQNATAGTAIRPVQRIAGGVPPSGVTGGAFHRGRLLVPGQNGLDPLQVWSVDVNGSSPSRLELELPINGEAEGVDVIADGSGLLHWLISPIAPGGRPPTYGSGRSALVSFVPEARAKLRVRLYPKRIAAGVTTTIAAKVTMWLGGRRWPVANATVTGGGGTGTTGTHGVAALTVGPQPPGLLRVQAAKQQLRPGRASLHVR